MTRLSRGMGNSVRRPNCLLQEFSMLRCRLVFHCIISLVVLLGDSLPADAQQTTVFGPISADSLTGVLREVTVPSGNPGVGDVISVLTGLEVATAPLGSPSGGFVYSYDEGVGAPLRRSSTFGPQFVERALTTGRGTTSFGLNVFNATYDTLSGYPLDNLRVATFRGPQPVISSSTLSMRLRSMTAALFGSVGVTDSFDVAVAVPIVRVGVNARMVQEEPGVGTAVLLSDGFSTGLGDIAVVGKYRFWRNRDERSGLAALVTLRMPTGNEDDLRGIGAWRTMVGLAASAELGRLAVHANGGYEFWSESVTLSNNQPGPFDEVWGLADQVQYGGAVEVEVHPTITFTVEAMGRLVRDSGRLDTVSFDTELSPELGVDGVDLLQVTSGHLRKFILVPGIKWNLGGNRLLSFGLRMAQADTGLRDTLTPLVGFNWTL